MKTIEITVKDKIATASDGAVYICGNSDYVVDFHFDAEWDAYDTKTARFAYNGTYQDQVFQGTQCPVPVIVDTRCITVGVFAGNIRVTTPAYISARGSILSEHGVPADPAPDVYAQIMELIQGLGDPDPETIAAAVAEYIRNNPIEETDPTVPAWAKAAEKPAYTAAEVGAISQEDLQAATDAALSQAKESGQFDGKPGKDGVDGKDGKPGADGEDGLPGKDGKDGITPTIGNNGNWYLGDTDTGKPSRGEKGLQGPIGATGPHGPKGDTGATGATGAPGADGYTPVKGTDYFTEADKQEIASAAAGMVSIPEKLPNPNALTFTGEATGTYDGSAPLTVNIPSGSGGGIEKGSCVYSKETLAEGTIAAGTAQYTFTDTGLSWLDVLRQWKVFYVEVYSTEKNQFNITGFQNNTVPIFIGKNSSCYSSFAFRSEGKSTNAVTFWRYYSGTAGNYWDMYSPGGTTIETAHVEHANQVFNVGEFGNLYIRNYGAATTVDVQWRVVGLIKWEE